MAAHGADNSWLVMLDAKAADGLRCSPSCPPIATRRLKVAEGQYAPLVDPLVAESLAVATHVVQLALP